MRLVFAGTPEFAAVSLEALLQARHEVTLVLTRPDRPAGRGLKSKPSAVKRVALARGLPLAQPATLRDAQAAQSIAAAAPDALVVAAYGLMVPPALLGLPPRGCLNVHASLLPRWRGAAPIQRALLAGDAMTGVSIMQMEATLDTGPVLLQASVPIAPEDTGGSLHDKLARLGARLLIEALATDPLPRAQNDQEATYARRIEKRESEIDWRKPAAEIERQVRAYHPAPGAQSGIDGTTIKIWRARVEPAQRGEPGSVLEVGAEGIVVACGTDALRVTELQRAGGKPLPAKPFLSGFSLARGARFRAIHG
jgi:methionyl-tRNA formyltransferase